MDQRDATTWVALELTYQGEAKVEDGTLEKVLRYDLGVDSNFPIFVPAATYLKLDKPITVHLLEGYVFISTGLPETAYFALEKKAYISKIMSSTSPTSRMRVLTTVADNYIQKLQTQLRQMIVSDVEINSRVKVLDGLYKNLDGAVLSLSGTDYAHVQIDLRSIRIIATVPMAFLEVI
jgi:transcription antitermination factor NusG